MKVEITGEKLHELLDSLPPEARKAFEGIIMKSASKAPMEAIKFWLKHYEDTDPIDTIIARTVASVISEIGIGIHDDVRQSRKSGKKEYDGKQAMICAVEKLRMIANQFQSHIDDYVCGSCTDQKH